jgi:putative DNA primase/helicase
LTTKDRPKDRVDDPFLIEKLKLETDNIFLWCLEGLKRLIQNNYKFTVSAKTERNLREAMEDGNNIISFMKSEGYIGLEKGTMATSKSLYVAYCKWCDDNTEKPLSTKSFSGYLKQNEELYGIKHSTNISIEHGKSARGFQGVFVKIRTDSN